MVNSFPPSVTKYLLDLLKFRSVPDMLKHYVIAPDLLRMSLGPYPNPTHSNSVSIHRSVKLCLGHVLIG